MRIRSVFVTVGALALLVTSASAQASQAVPNEVRRRLAQVVWPENLFDSTGAPERGFVRRTFQPAYADLRIRSGDTVGTLPGVALYIGTAYPSGCFDCRTRRYAVAKRAGEYVSLLRPDDIQYLGVWASPEAFRDTASLRQFVLRTLAATCLVECDLAIVTKLADLGYPDSTLVTSSASPSRPVPIPRAYARQQDGWLVVEFALHSRGYGLFAVRAEYGNGRPLHVSITQVARTCLCM